MLRNFHRGWDSTSGSVYYYGYSRWIQRLSRESIRVDRVDLKKVKEFMC